jgi:hypothetical protein
MARQLGLPLSAGSEALLGAANKPEHFAQLSDEVVVADVAPLGGVVNVVRPRFAVGAPRLTPRA